GAVFSRDHHRLTYTGMSRQPGLDFSQFNPKAPHFHLVVSAPDKLQIATGQPAGRVARLVQTTAVLERAGEEALISQIATVQIAAGKARTADVQFARHANWHRLQP